MTAEGLAKAKTVNDFLKTAGMYALIASILWAVSEIRETKAMVMDARRDAAVMSERVASLTERVSRVEVRMDRHEEREPKK